MSLPILVVDDEPAHRNLFVRLLRDAGYAVCGAADGEAALAALPRARPVLVITDLRMPRFTGQELVAHLQRHHPQIRIIVISALSQDMALSGLPFLAKPFPLADLLACAKEVLAREPQRESGQAAGMMVGASTTTRRP